MAFSFAPHRSITLPSLGLALLLAGCSSGEVKAVGEVGPARASSSR